MLCRNRRQRADGQAAQGTGVQQSLLVGHCCTSRQQSEQAGWGALQHKSPLHPFKSLKVEQGPTTTPAACAAPSTQDSWHQGAAGCLLAHSKLLAGSCSSHFLQKFSSIKSHSPYNLSCSTPAVLGWELLGTAPTCRQAGTCRTSRPCGPQYAPRTELLGAPQL